MGKHRLSGQHNPSNQALPLFLTEGHQEGHQWDMRADIPVGCHIDYNDLHLLCYTILPSGLLQYQCCSAPLHMVQLGREITLLYTDGPTHLFSNLRLAGDRNFSFFKLLRIKYIDTHNAKSKTTLLP